jgi:hypothetical protein
MDGMPPPTSFGVIFDAPIRWLDNKRNFDRAVISGSAVIKSTATSKILSKSWRTRFGLGGVAPRAPGRQGEIGLSEIS